MATVSRIRRHNTSGASGLPASDSSRTGSGNGGGDKKDFSLAVAVAKKWKMIACGVIFGFCMGHIMLKNFSHHPPRPAGNLVREDPVHEEPSHADQSPILSSPSIPAAPSVGGGISIGGSSSIAAGPSSSKTKSKKTEKKKKRTRIGQDSGKNSTHATIEVSKAAKISAPEEPALYKIPNHRQCTHKKGRFPKTGEKGGGGTVRYRDRTQNEWYSEGCNQWGLTGEWKRRDRKIYYGFMFADEAEILQVVLHEIYPVVDVIIILECTQTWQGEAKPLFFPKFNKTRQFQPYADKIRYIPYNFDDDKTANFLTRCLDEELAGPNWPPGQMQCRWIRQWGARDFIATGAHDMRPHDVFVVADLDELLAREFLRAVHYCDVFPEGAGPGKEERCGRMGVFTYGHKYYFDCTVDKAHGHYHPNLALGRCLDVFGAEELKRWWGEPKKYFPKPKDLLDTKMAGPGGWHMHSFLSTARVLWKWFSRSGRSSREHRGKWDNKWDINDLAEIRSQRQKCNEQAGFMTFDSEACEPLPHLIREDPVGWGHYIRYVSDDDLPDSFDIQGWYHDRLLEKFDNSSGEFGGSW